MADAGAVRVRETEAPRQRSRGRIAVSAELRGRTSRISSLAEAGPLRLRFPTVHGGGPPEGVIVNTAGGLACGDDMAVEAWVGPGASLVLTTAAAEKLYRSTGPTTLVSTRLAVAAGGRAEWLPQESILYDRVRLRRSLDVDVEDGASALLFEALVFGRAAHGETLRTGSLADRWRVRRGGRLVFADTFRLDGHLDARLALPTVAAGHRAMATLLDIGPEAETRLDGARELLAGSVSECGASAWNGMLLVRWLGPEIGTLRRDVARFMTSHRGRPLPRVWSS